MINLKITTKTHYERMQDGELFTGMDEDLSRLMSETRARVRRYNALPDASYPVMRSELEMIVGELGEYSSIEPPFTIDYGQHLRLGRRVFVNSGATFLSSAFVIIGDNTLVGPNVQFITSNHPIDPKKRYIETPNAPNFPFRTVSIASPILIGANCWIGAGAIILAGVSIGEGTTIGAGSVVTRDIPANVFAAGNPARVIRTL